MFIYELWRLQGCGISLNVSINAIFIDDKLQMLQFWDIEFIQLICQKLVQRIKFIINKAFKMETR